LDNLSWEEVENNGIPDAEVVINLSGYNLFAKKWDEAGKKVLTDSRVVPMKLLKQAIDRRAKLGQFVPKVDLLVSVLCLFCYRC